MTTQIIKGAEVSRPSVTPLTSSVLDHATVVDNADHFGKRNNAGLWPSYNCLDTMVPTVICPAPTAEKVFDFVPWIPGFEFSIYGGVQCKAVGLDVEDQHTELRRVFEANEGRGVEQALLLNRFIALVKNPASTDARDAEWAAPVNLNPVTAVPVQVALALLEGYAASTYAGVPTIHMPRMVASLLGSDQIKWVGDKAFTNLGSKVAIGGGYDSDVLPFDGTFDLYATGEVYVERGGLIDIHTYKLPGDGASFDDNTVIALAERSFRVAVDCFVAKATGTVWA